MKSLSKKAKYIVACSYGPDSMALLNMLIEEKYNVVVAHVNYHKRDASNFEEESLRKFCANKNIEIENAILDMIASIEAYDVDPKITKVDKIHLNPVL